MAGGNIAAEPFESRTCTSAHVVSRVLRRCWLGCAHAYHASVCSPLRIIRVIYYIWSRSVRAETKECFLLPLPLAHSSEPLASFYRSSLVPRPKRVQGAAKDGARSGIPWGRAKRRRWGRNREGQGGTGGAGRKKNKRSEHQRRNRPFHLYAARIQLTLHLLLSFFFSSLGRRAWCCSLPLLSYIHTCICIYVNIWYIFLGTSSLGVDRWFEFHKYTVAFASFWICGASFIVLIQKMKLFPTYVYTCEYIRDQLVFR